MQLEGHVTITTLGQERSRFPKGIFQEWSENILFYIFAVFKRQYLSRGGGVENVVMIHVGNLFHPSLSARACRSSESETTIEILRSSDIDYRWNAVACQKWQNGKREL